jgi:hypothetical protein
MEELLSGELEETIDAVWPRASLLLDELGASASENSSEAAEIARLALNTLALAPIAERRHALLPEVHVYASQDGGRTLVGGRADAVAFEEGRPSVVFDWKSDTRPTDNERRAYGNQILEYARSVGAARGAVVYMSLGKVEWFTFA